MPSYFEQNDTSPTHISVAALVTRPDGKLLCHYFKKEDLPHESEGKSDLHLVMRETLHQHETLEAAVARGLMEEYGAEGTITNFLGSIVSHFPYTFDAAVTIEKTVLYFLVELTSLDETKREEGAVESRSELRWLAPAELLAVNQQQAALYDRTDIDDSKIIKTYIELYGN